MKQLPALALAVAFSGNLIAQEKSESPERTRDTSPARQREAGRERDAQPDRTRAREAARSRTASDRRSRKVEVKDPAEFAKLTREGVFSGPQAGEKLPSFQATGLAGDIKDDEVDPIELAGTKPHVLLMQDDEGVGIRGLFGMVRLLAKVNAKIDPGLHITCVFLTDDIEKTTASAARFGQTFLKTGLDVLVLSKDGRDGPGAYGLNRTVSQTVILSKGGKVTHNFVFPQGSLYADPHVLGGVAELIDVEREKLAAWLNEAAPESERMDRRASMQRNAARSRDAAPVSSGKVALREKLGKLVAAERLTREEAMELFQAAFPEDKGRGAREGARR